jgi:phosphatidylglycerophosphate synthase
MLFTNEQFDQISEFHEKVFERKDLFTVANAVTISSLALVLDGCREIDTIAGVNKIVLGRTGDLLDGYLARLLNQTSDTGALIDTAADKIGMTAILGSAWHKNAVPKMPLSVIAGKQALNVGLTAITARNHPHQGFRPVTTGKYAMAADNAALIGYLYSNAFRLEKPEENLHQGWAMLGRTAFAAGSALSLPATLEYADRAFRR